jgi:hypothetical protein
MNSGEWMAKLKRGTTINFQQTGILGLELHQPRMMAIWSIANAQVIQQG